MPGLDNLILNKIDYNQVIEHIKLDIRSDFILAPHYTAVFNRAGEKLWDSLKNQLKNGTYQPSLPITMSVPKERFFTRPGSILEPQDRFLYQALVEEIMVQLEESMDRDRTFSHLPSSEEGEIFLPNHDCWQNFQSSVSEICDNFSIVLKADISNYFERLPQHHLINLMRAAECSANIVNLIEEMMLSFRERQSFGIIQGVFPSDILGNFFLSDFDAYCELRDIQSARYVDDIYMGFDDENIARNGLGELIENLRKDGLHLNEYKSKIMSAEDVLHEETAIDRAFDEIRDEIDEDLYERINPYGFDVEWEEDNDSDDDIDEEELENEAVIRLIHNISDYPNSEDQVEKFCLPILRSSHSDDAIDHVINNLRNKPHQTRLYFSYLSKFVRGNIELVNQLENLINTNGISNYQKMFLLAALMRSERIERETVNTALQLLQNKAVAKETRAMAAIFSAKHGTAQQKRMVRTSYEEEPSDYVKSAILYSSRYLTIADRRTCKRAWGGHNEINSLISQTI